MNFISDMYTIEFQKRGLPQAYILIFLPIQQISSARWYWQNYIYWGIRSFETTKVVESCQEPHMDHVGWQTQNVHAWRMVGVPRIIQKSFKM